MKAKKAHYNIAQKLVMLAGKDILASGMVFLLATLALVIYGWHSPTVQNLLGYPGKMGRGGAFVVILFCCLPMIIIWLIDKMFVARNRKSYWRDQNKLFVRVLNNQVVDYGKAVWKRSPGQIIEIALPEKGRHRCWFGRKEENQDAEAEILFNVTLEAAEFDPQEVYQNIYLGAFESFESCLRHRVGNLSLLKPHIESLCRGETTEEELLNVVKSVLACKSLKEDLANGFSNVMVSETHLHASRSVAIEI